MLVDAFLENVRRQPHKLAAQDPTRRATYRELMTLAKAIRRLVLAESRCDRVGIVLPSTVGGLGTLFGVMWAGRTAVPINFLLQPTEIAAVVADAGIDLILSTAHFKKLLADIPVRVLYLEEIGLKRRFLVEKLRRTPEPPRVDAQDVAVILYTSGTTGRPKGVCLTHGNFANNCTASIEHLRIDADSQLLGIIPLFHSFGLTVLNFIPIVLGATVTFIPRFSPQASRTALREQRITHLIGVPSMFNAIGRLKNVRPEDFASVQVANSGGDALPRAVYDLFHERCGVRVCEGYGLTETSPVLSADVPWDHHVGTIGKPLRGVEVQLRDEDGNVLTDPADQGELCTRGPMVMQGYFRQPEETARAIDGDGWFRTGDIARIDAEGYLSITGRAKDMIIVGGENVYPREIENVLERHPAVRECAVVGQGDGSRGEVVVGFVALDEEFNATPDELRTFCRDHLAGFKVPRQIHIEHQLPRTPTGKVLKRDLRALLVQ